MTPQLLWERRPCWCRDVQLIGDCIISEFPADTGAACAKLHCANAVRGRACSKVVNARNVREGQMPHSRLL